MQPMDAILLDKPQSWNGNISGDDEFDDSFDSEAIDGSPELKVTT